MFENAMVNRGIFFIPKTREAETKPHASLNTHLLLAKWTCREFTCLALCNEKAEKPITHSERQLAATTVFFLALNAASS
jgi:hypothetical protein